MRREDDRLPLLGQLTDAVPEAPPGSDIKPDSRLVEEHQLGVARQGEGEAEATLLPAGQLLGIPV
ncbi:hypothetical protein D3C76_1616460 [compost metagenome]